MTVVSTVIFLKIKHKKINSLLQKQVILNFHDDLAMIYKDTHL